MINLRLALDHLELASEELDVLDDVQDWIAKLEAERDAARAACRSAASTLRAARRFNGSLQLAAIAKVISRLEAEATGELDDCPV